MGMVEDDALALYRRAVGALNARRWHEAGRIAEDLLRRLPRHPGLHFVAAVAAYEVRALDLALRHMHDACTLQPDNAEYAAQMARMLASAQRMDEALAQAGRAVALGVDEPVALAMVGVVFARANEHGQALRAFQRAVEKAPDRPGLRYNLGSCLSFFGRMEAAEQEYRAALALNPRYWRVYLSLAHLRRWRVEDNELDLLRRTVADAGDDPEARLYLNLALAKQYEDVGDHRAAFACYVAGKEGLKRARGYTSARDQAMFDAVRRAFPADFAAAPGHADAAPIFVVGMPRSGTTLVERVLSSHPQVTSAGELDCMPLAVKQLAATATPDVVDAATLAHADLDWAALGHRYLDLSRSAAGSTPRFVDKLPHNFLYIGHIARALPNAKIICLRRDPMDTCLGNFRQLFELATPNYDYSFDLLDIGRYYQMFDGLMAHWQSRLPGRIHELRYEDLVHDQEAATRDLLAFCDLPWDAACLAFDRNDAPVATASVAQVREPLTSRYIGRWRRYGADVDALAAMLGVEATTPG